MIKPDERINRAITNLQGNQNWEIVRKWIEDSFIAQATQNATDIVSDERKDTINKGKAMQLHILKEVINKAIHETKKAGK